jgi:hypothetical protein
MARIINGVAISDDYETIVGPIEGYERPTAEREVKFLPGPAKAKRLLVDEPTVVAPAVTVVTKAPKVSEVNG